MPCVKETLTLHHLGEGSPVNRTNRDNSNSGIVVSSRDKVSTRKRRRRILRNSSKSKASFSGNKQKTLIRRWVKRMQGRDRSRDSLEVKDLECLKTSLS